MGALANATALRMDQTFKSWVETGIAYQARLVITNENAQTPDYNYRIKLARDAATTPATILDMMVTVVATNPALATKGSTVGPATNQVGESDILQAIQDAWTTVAKLVYPEA